ncbi:MAG: metallophosphoesterase [Bryobacteraceae bacterium]
MSRSIVHLSDLHFNKVDDALIEPLIAAVEALSPDFVAVSGDFTQHAYPIEFERAAELLKRLPGKHILVPGNHDMAFYNVWRRASQRLKLYKQYISDNMFPYYADADIAILGLNTARVTHLRDGRIRSIQVDLLEKTMQSAPKSAVRVLVTHHPFDLPSTYAASELIGDRVFNRVVRCVDVMLAGHMHVSGAGPTASRYKVAGTSAVFVQAGTALSTRARGEPNGFQLICVEPSSIRVTAQIWSGDAFVAGWTRAFIPGSQGWSEV